MQLRALHLERFCGFENFRIEFQECTVLIGPNNGGKTTILRALDLVFRTIQSDQFIAQITNARNKIEAAEVNFRKQVDALKSTAAGRSTNIDASLRALEQQYAQQTQNATDQLRKNPTDIATVVTAQGFASAASLVYDHNLAAGSKIDITLRTDQTEVHLVGRIHSAGRLSLDVLCNNESLLAATGQEKRAILDKVLALKVEFVPISIVVLPQEQALSWPQMQQHIQQAREFEVWRNRIHWLSEGKDPQRYKKVVDRVRASLPSVQLNAAGRTKEQQPKVVLTYVEKGVAHDVSESGGGFRTLLGLAASVELSDADILLFDEPDAHLHSAVQRQAAEFLFSSANSSKQIVVSTHAPDMIEEFPLNSLLWIDRGTNSASSADSISQALVGLGVASHRQAFQLLAAQAHLYFEDKPDQRALSKLMERCGNAALLKATRSLRLRGAGDSLHLPTFARLIESHAGKKIPMVAILDADYEVNRQSETEGLVLKLRLPCKEIENLLLLQPKAILSRLIKAAESRPDAELPDLHRIEELIDTQTASDNITKQVQFQWIAKRCPEGRQPEAGELKALTEEFRTKWEDPAFRRRFCPGKLALTGVKRALQEATKLSFSTDSVFDFYEPNATKSNLYSPRPRSMFLIY